MKSLILIKYSEIALKGKNQPFFIKKLIDNIKSKLKDIDHEVLRKYGRLYLLTEEKDTETATSVLKRIFGIYSFSRAIQTAKDITEIEGAAITLANKLVEKTSLPEGIKFKVEARRIDKSFPFTSYDIACRLGDKLRHTFKELKVDVNNPDWILNVEIRELAYLYGPGQTGPGGLPVGVSGKGMLLLSGGIDSPVAGYLMAKRGMNINAIYFHTYPFTSDDVLKKVKQIMKVLFSFLPKSRLFIVPFTDIQLLIKGKADAGQITLLSRACMMQIASQIAKNSGFHCLITGESLGQVSSQTVQSLAFTGSKSQLPVFRPLIGMNKEEIIKTAREIGTYDISILPYPDCCTIFAPKHPITRPHFWTMIKEFKRMEIEGLILKAVQKTEKISF